MKTVQMQELILQSECYTFDYELSAEDYAEFAGLKDNDSRREFLEFRVPVSSVNFTHQMRDSLELDFVETS